MNLQAYYYVYVMKLDFFVNFLGKILHPPSKQSLSQIECTEIKL